MSPSENVSDIDNWVQFIDKLLTVAIPITPSILICFATVCVATASLVLYQVNRRRYDIRRKSQGTSFNQNAIRELENHVEHGEERLEKKQEGSSMELRLQERSVGDRDRPAVDTLSAEYGIDSIVAAKNKRFLDANSSIPEFFKKHLFGEVENGELLYWADVPSYRFKHSKTLRNGLIMDLTAFCMSVLFGVISIFIVTPDHALATSFVGSLASLLPFLPGLYYCISMRQLNVLYALTDRRILFCKKKGFFRTSSKSFTYIYEQSQNQFLKEKRVEGEAEIGDLLFLKNSAVLTENMEWKVNKNAIGMVGFKGVNKVEEVEHVIRLKLEEVAKGLQRNNLQL